MPIERDDRPRRVPAHAEAADADGSITVRNGRDTVELNATAAALWALCDGDTTVGEIVTAATSFFSGPQDGIERDIITALEALDAQGLVVT
jgi:hypothetical protein